MVFFLQEACTERQISLGPQKTYSVGRDIHHCDILIINDKSVSHDHALIKTKDDEVYIQDKGSKQGTFVNNIAISRSTKLQNQDEIVFGNQDCKFIFFSLQYETVLDGSVIGPRRENISRILENCQVKVSEEWTNTCTHLTVEKISLSTPILKAVIDRKPLVLGMYWLALEKSMETMSAPPEPEDFLPVFDDELSAKGIKKVRNTLERKFLFENTLFVLLDKKLYNEVSDIVEKCAGFAVVYRNALKINKCLSDNENIKEIVIVRSKKHYQSQINFIRRDVKKAEVNVEVQDIEDLYLSILKGKKIQNSNNNDSNSNGNKGDKKNKNDSKKKSELVVIDEESPNILQEKDRNDLSFEATEEETVNDGNAASKTNNTVSICLDLTGESDGVGSKNFVFCNSKRHNCRINPFARNPDLMLEAIKKRYKQLNVCLVPNEEIRHKIL